MVSYRQRGPGWSWTLGVSVARVVPTGELRAVVELTGRDGAAALAPARLEQLREVHAALGRLLAHGLPEDDWLLWHGEHAGEDGEPASESVDLLGGGELRLLAMVVEEPADADDEDDEAEPETWERLTDVRLVVAPPAEQWPGVTSTAAAAADLDLDQARRLHVALGVVLDRLAGTGGAR